MQKKNGFTLVELLVVIAILAILATAAIVSYTVFIDRGYESNARTTIAQIRRLLIDEDSTNDDFEITDEGIVFADDNDITDDFTDLYDSLDSDVATDKILIVASDSAITSVIYKYSDEVYGVWDCVADATDTPDDTEDENGISVISDKDKIATLNESAKTLTSE